MARVRESETRLPALRLLAFVVVLGAGAGLVAGALLGSGPGHYVRCQIEGRDGWYVDLPSEARTATEVRRAIRRQTACVSVEVGHVDWGHVPDGELAVRLVNRTAWVERGGAIKVWEEGTSTDDCAPLGPRSAPPVGCPGGPQDAR